jgi:hypothetical protein
MAVAQGRVPGIRVPSGASEKVAVGARELVS